MAVTPFTPQNAATVNIDISSSNQRVKYSNDGFSQQVRVMNNGTATAWIAFGDVTITAALATGIPVGPGVTEVYSITSTPGTSLYAAAIAAGSTGKIYFTPGVGN